MIDIHAHILPGVDDGAKNMEEALEIARGAVRQGIEKIVATPHYLPDTYSLTSEEIAEKVNELQYEIDREGLKLKILTGAEIYLEPDFCHKLQEGLLTTVNNSRYLMIELPFNHLPPYAEGVLYDILAMGYIPVICHPERYSFFGKRPEILYEWVSNGIYAQLNAGSLTGEYGNTIRKTAELMVKHKLVQLMGSDVHSKDWKRGLLKNGFQHLNKNDNETYHLNSERLLNNEVLTTELPIAIKEGIFKKIRHIFKK